MVMRWSVAVSEQRQQFETDLRRNVVDHRAAFDRFDLQFVVVSHGGSP